MENRKKNARYAQKMERRRKKNNIETCCREMSMKNQ